MGVISEQILPLEPFLQFGSYGIRMKTHAIHDVPGSLATTLREVNGSSSAFALRENARQACTKHFQTLRTHATTLARLLTSQRPRFVFGKTFGNKVWYYEIRDGQRLYKKAGSSWSADTHWSLASSMALAVFGSEDRVMTAV